jgi:divalent metal cation (Fe/Co/Zn/Cd) transporter
MATESRTLVILALIAKGVTAVVKSIAAGVSGSFAMLSTGFHSVAETGNQRFLLPGPAAARYSPDGCHPLGRGKELSSWSLTVAARVFVGGAVIAFLEALQRSEVPEATRIFIELEPGL